MARRRTNATSGAGDSRTSRLSRAWLRMYFDSIIQRFQHRMSAKSRISKARQKAKMRMLMTEEPYILSGSYKLKYTKSRLTEYNSNSTCTACSLTDFVVVGSFSDGEREQMERDELLRANTA